MRGPKTMGVHVRWRVSWSRCVGGLLPVLLAVAFSLVVSACGGGGGEDEAAPVATVASEAPATEAPATEAPATEAPTTEAPATEAPTTEAPTTEAPTTTSNRACRPPMLPARELIWQVSTLLE